MINKISIYIFVTFLISQNAFSQNQREKELITIEKYVGLENTVVHSKKSLHSSIPIKTNNIQTTAYADVIWEKTPWEIPELNFFPNGLAKFAGDINGDGYTDFVKAYSDKIPDERTDILEDYTYKSLIYFGGAEYQLSPNQVIYGTVIPIGDLNGDGYSDGISKDIFGEIKMVVGSLSGYLISDIQVNNDLASSILSIINSNSTNEVLLFNDINNDGSEDIAGFYRSLGDSSISSYYFEFLGANSFSEVKYSEFQIPVDYFLNYNAQYTVNDATYYLFNRPNSYNYDESYLVRKESADFFLEATYSYLTDSSKFSGFTRFLDVTGDGVIDLLFEEAESGSVLKNSSEAKALNSDLFYRRLYLVKGDNTQEALFDTTLNPLEGQLIYSIGNSISFEQLPNIDMIQDFDLDGIPDFIIYDEEDFSFASIVQENGDYSLVTHITYSISDFLNNGKFAVNQFNRKLAHHPYPTGRNTENGKSYVLTLENSQVTKHITFSTDTTEIDLFNNLLINEIEFEKNAFIQKINEQVFLLDDLEGDGVDNFGVLQSWDGKETLINYNGFSVADTTHIKIPSGMFLREAYGGYFIDDKKKSLMILLSDGKSSSSAPLGGDKIHIYSLDNFNTPTETIVVENQNRLDVAARLGDINGDGFDDIGTTNPMSFNSGHILSIYLGGNTISNNPDINIDYRNLDIPGFGGSQFGITTLQGNGDLNEDGVDDFLVGDSGRFFNISSSSLITGLIYVHYGKKNDSLDFSKPDAVLYPDTSNLENRQWFFGLNEIASGDFNGDGRIDLASKSFHHSTSGFDEGVGAIHYFFGKENGFQGQPDTTIRIRTEYISTSGISEVEGIYSRFGARELLYGIPDLNNDGSDELLFVPGSRKTNAVLYEIGTSPNENGSAFFKAPNQRLAINPSGNFINLQFRSVVGDFTGDGTLSFIVYQNDPNYRDQPLYLYDFSELNLVSNSDEITDTPLFFSLEQNYPNPFNPSTNISFSIPNNAQVKLEVFNILGQKVKELVNNRMPAGTHTIKFDASSLSSGMYFYRIEAGKFSQTKKMLLIK